MRLGIGAKIGGLCFGLVLMAGVFARWAFYRTGQVFVEHELIDLGDDTRIQAFKLESAVRSLREASLRLAAGADENANQAADVRDCRQLLQDNPLLLRAALLEGGEAKTAGCQAWRSAAGAEVTTECGDAVGQDPSVRARALLPVGAGPVRPGTVWLSGLQRSTHPAHRGRLVMRAVVPLVHRPGWLALAELDFEMLADDLNDSPRHITFLSDERGRLLLHPGATGRTVEKGGESIRMQDLFPALAEYYLPGRPASENEELARIGRLLAVPPEEFARAFLPGEGRYFTVFRLRDTHQYQHTLAADRERLLRALQAEQRKAERRGNPGGARLNFSHTSRGMPPKPEIGRHTTRLVVSGPAKEDVERVRRTLKREFALDAAPPQPARHFALHFFKVFYDPNQPERFLGLAWAASTEEIKADFDAEVSAVQWWILGVIVLGLLLVPLFSVMITQPLRRLTQVTSHIAAGVFEESSLEEAEQAPGEIGRLAGSFRQMVEQLRERSEALRRLNEELEARVAERTAELHQANAELAAARDHAFAASRAKSAFLANMSHELRTPLNAIIGYSEMLAEEAAEAGLEGFQTDLAKILASGRHLLALINDILDHSKIEAGRVQLVLEEFSVAALLDEVAATLRVLAKRHGNTIVVQYQPAIGRMYADLTRVRQVLYNLMSNACKFTEQGQITVSAVRETSNGQEWIYFTVSDTGLGMSSEQLGGLFQEFAQLDNSTRRRFEGTGLGLAISKRLVELMGGTISVESELGRGSTFTVRLPAVVRPPQPLRSEHAPQAIEGDPRPHTDEGPPVLLTAAGNARPPDTPTPSHALSAAPPAPTAGNAADASSPSPAANAPQDASCMPHSHPAQEPDLA